MWDSWLLLFFRFIFYNWCFVWKSLKIFHHPQKLQNIHTKVITFRSVCCAQLQLWKAPVGVGNWNKLGLGFKTPNNIIHGGSFPLIWSSFLFYEGWASVSLPILCIPSHCFTDRSITIHMGTHLDNDVACLDSLGWSCIFLYSLVR